MPDEGKNWEIFGHVCMFANGGTSCVPALLAVDGFFFHDHNQAQISTCFIF